MKNLSNRKSKQKILIPFFVLILFVASFLSCFYHYKRIKQIQINSDKTTVDILQNLLSSYQKASLAILQSRANNSHFKDIIEKKKEEGVSSHLAELKKNNKEIDWLFVTDSSGVLWANYPIDKIAYGKDLSHRDWYKGVKENWNPYISSIFKLIVGEKELGSAVCVPVLNEKGRTIGILANAQRTFFLQSIIEKVFFDENAKVTIVDQIGQMVYSNSYSIGKELVQHPYLPMIRKASVEQRNNYEKWAEKIYFTTASSEVSSWTIIIERSNKSILLSGLFYYIQTVVFATLVLIILIIVTFSNYKLRQQISRREKLERDLIKSEERLTSFIQSASDGIILFDSQLNHIEMNKIALEMTGYKRKDVIGKNVVDTVPNIKESGLYDEYKKVIKTGLPYHIDDLTLHPLTGKKHFNLKAFKVSGGLGIIFSDITELKHAEEELLKRENQYNAIVENSGDYIMRYDRSHRHIWANQNAIKSTGLPPEQFLDKTHREMSFPEHLCELWEKNIDKVFSTGEVRRVEFDVELKNGLMTLDLQFNPELDEDGNVLSVIGVSRDITDRKLKEKRYKKTIESSFDGFWVTDLKGNFLEVNEAYSRMVGYSRDELLKMSIMSVETVEHHEETKKRIEKIVKIGSDRFETKHRHKNGSIVDVEVSAAYTHDNDGQFFVFLSDITERNKMEGQLRQAQKMESIGTLAGGIAHDFNNILSSIIGFSELALGEAEKGTELEDDLQEVRTAGLRAKDLVKQILAFARQSEEAVKPIQVNIIAQEVINFIKSSIPTTIQINDKIDSDSFIMGSPTQVHQVLMNLCTNAAQAMEENGGVLEISVNDTTIDMMAMIHDLRPGGYIEIKVSDTGMGISPQNVHTIFEPYFTTKPVGEGTGMGLAVVHGIVENHDGQITVDSTIGKGTCFTIYLPITKKRKVQMHQEKENLPLGNENILFVDDEAPIAKMGGKVLEQLGYSVTTRTSSVEALELFRSKPQAFDLVVTDMTMPNMTGDKLAAEIMNIRSDISVVLCTGYSKKISEESAAEIGIKAFAYKPIVKADLAKTVRKVLDETKSSE